MQLSKRAYYADFGIYAFVVLAVAVWVATWPSPAARMETLLSALVGAALWTLAEYLLHRFVLHSHARIALLHVRHHMTPKAYIGTPTWLSAGIIVGLVFIPAWVAFSLPIATGLSAGFALAFLWYGIIHHVMHHHAPHVLTPLLREATKRHFRHHGSFGNSNFGVTTELWDRVFGTHRPIRSARALRSEFPRDGR